MEKEDVRRHAGGMPLLIDLSLAMRTDILALIRGITKFVTVIYGPAVTFVFPDVKVEAYRRSVLHLNLISAMDGSTLNWCEQNVLRESMSVDFLFEKIAEPEMTAINFSDPFRDRMGEVQRGHIEVFPKLRPYDKFEALRQNERRNNKNSLFNGLLPKSERRNERLGRLQKAARRNI